ncbi:hypothetical protein HJG53_09815 [Sphingomonas sp. ID1715]|uniref:hypothetical protein n=1 Tax=Sphingomonas sp. ID1715 TaxID=1656898 RepID=UPI001488D2C5|nr:hypothetical protein [Sphingomonas sp. ID1715]NNM77198.1 hypothetical protein [Sphingomonas sp. ID1715]
MRKMMMGLLLAATAAAPALADKGGKGGGHGNGHGGGKHAQADFKGHGGGRHAQQGWSRAPAFADRGAQHRRAPPMRWYGADSFSRPIRVVRVDDKQARKAWKRELKEERKFARAVSRDEFRRPDRWTRVAPQPVYYERPIYAPVRYAEPVIRYAQPVYVRTYAQPYYPAAYAPSYGYADPYSGYYPAYSSGTGLFGGGNNLLSTLLPIVLSGVLGGDLGTGLGGWAGATGLAGLGGLSGAGYSDYSAANYGAYDGYASYGDYGNFTDYGGYTALSELTGADPYALPLQQIGYGDSLSSGLLPASYTGEGLGSLLVPALLGRGGSLF